MRNTEKQLSEEWASTKTWKFDLKAIEKAISVQVNYSNAAPSAKAFAFSDVDVAANTITEASHGYKTGLKGQLTTSGGLPTGLSAATDYFVIYIDANTYKLASSLANAEAGTAVDITAQGTGNHTFTPTAATGNVLKLQASNDDTNYKDISGKTVTIGTSSGTELWELGEVSYRYLRALYTPSAGQIRVEIWPSY